MTQQDVYNIYAEAIHKGLVRNKEDFATRVGVARSTMYYVMGRNSTRGVSPTVAIKIMQFGEIVKHSSTRFFDWEDYRRNATREFACAILSNPNITMYRQENVPLKEKVIKTALELADELIKNLKGE